MSNAPNSVSVFLVEDDPGLMFVLEESIKSLGYSVGQKSEQLADAMERARSVGFDVALLDVNLHGENSFPVADVLRGRGIPFAFTTGLESNSLPVRFKDSAIMEKPFRLADIQIALRTLEAALSDA